MTHVEFSEYMKNVKWQSAIRFYIASITFALAIAGLYYGILSSNEHLNSSLTLVIVKSNAATNKKIDSSNFIHNEQIDKVNAQFDKIWDVINGIKPIKHTYVVSNRPGGGCQIEKVINGKTHYIPVSCD